MKRSYKNKNNPNYKHAKTLLKNSCLDCGKILKYYLSKRCRKCSDYQHKLRMQGARNPFWSGGKPNCMDCGKKLSSYAYKRCSSCSKRGELNYWSKNRIPEKQRLLFIKNRKLWKGKLHPNYIDGRSFLPYTQEFNKELKQRIKERDNYTCQKCGIKEKKHLIKYKQKLHVHHIDYNKENNDEKNLITTCLPCNVKANYNRLLHKIYFKRIISEKSKRRSKRSCC